MKHTYEQKTNNIAVYWDFENIHISLCNINYGDCWCGQRADKSKQPPIMNIDSIMEFITSLGVVNINRAYANWGNFYAYNEPLQNHSIDLIQLFPRTRAGKNGSDIRMSIDIIQDLVQSQHIDTVVLIGGDSDYIAVSQKVRQMGKQIIGIGLQETTSQFFIKSCNEFKFYSSLLVKSASRKKEDDGTTADLNEAKSLLRKTIRAHSERTGSDTILRVQLKPLLIRVDSTFDEGNYGFKTFSDFLTACDDILSFEKGEHDLIISLKDAQTEEDESMVDGYELILHRQGIRLVPHNVLLEALKCTVEIFSGGKSVDSYSEYIEKIGNHFTSKNIEFDKAYPSNVQGIMFKTFMFYRKQEDNTIALKKEYPNHNMLFIEILRALLKKIIHNSTSEIDTAKAARLLLGDEGQKDQIEKLLERIGQNGTAN